jgi:hypothetical protein
VHVFEDLKQAPTLTLITLCVQDSFSFEVHIIDKRVTALWRARQSLELLLNVRTLSRRGFRQHFRQRILQPGNQEFSLKIHGTGEKLAQLSHFRCVLGMKKFRSRIPGTWAVADSQEQSWQFGSTLRNKADEFWKTFFERSTLAPWVPDKVADAKRREIFAFIPRGQPGNSSIAFVLPDFFSDLEGLAVRERDRAKCLGQRGNAREHGKRSKKMSSAVPATMLFLFS